METPGNDSALCKWLTYAILFSFQVKHAREVASEPHFQVKLQRVIGTSSTSAQYFDEDDDLAKYEGKITGRWPTRMSDLEK